MSLPGKLCIGILEEDNPQKSYFRLKPLLVEADGRYVPYDAPDAYPLDGGIRIVPDKNESYHFKSRMRELGLFCVVDLRAHPGESDKIRPNKNYREDGPERNAYIIYSDVVRAPAPAMIFQLLPEALRHDTLTRPHTADVLLRGEAVLPERYEWESLPGDDDRAQLLPTDRAADVEKLQVFDLEGFSGHTVSFAILPPSEVERVSDAPAPRPVEKREAPRPAAEKPEPAAQKPEAPADKPEAAPPAARPEPPRPAAEKPEPPRPELSHPDAPADKPWLHHDDSMLPPPVDPRLSPAQRSLAAQSGLNPRRGRSLQELIDEKWQRSRLSQLGQTPAALQTVAPVASPVESATQAVRDVWNQPQLRKDLLESLGGIEEFGASLEEVREAARQSDIERHLEGLEARRLALLSELDHLNLKNADTRKALKRELRKDAEADLTEALQKADAAKAEQAKYERLAEDARAAAQDARKAVDDLTGEELEQRLTQFALNEHMLERMRQIRGEAEAVPPAPPTLQDIDLNALAVRVMNRFDASGFAITRLEALNLCACAAVSPVLILSGPVGCGKTETARMLTQALGWDTADRCAAFAPGRDVAPNDPRLETLRSVPRTPAMLLLDDANLRPAPDPLLGLDRALEPGWRLCLTVQDGGMPLPAHALDRGFTLRLAAKPAAPWRPRAKTPCAPEAPARLDMAIPDAPLPAAMESRMDALRAALDRKGAPVSRRALDDAWRYCALMLSALGETADPAAILDRAVAQRILPALLAEAPAAALAALPALLDGLPLSRHLLTQPLPVML